MPTEHFIPEGTVEHLLRELKKIENIIYKDAEGKPIQLSSGGMSDYYVDIKKAYGHPPALHAIVDCLQKKIKEQLTNPFDKPQCIAAAGYGGVPPAVLLATKYDYKLTLIRDQEKQHGKGGFFDGYVPQGPTPHQKYADNVVLVDDVFTSDNSLRKAAKLIESTGAKTVGAFVVVKRGPGNLDDISIPLYYLLTPDDLLLA